MINVTLNGVTYSIPETSDEDWGDNLTDYLVAISTTTLQKTGGAFTLTAEVNFGNTFGLKAPYYKSVTSNIATAGVLRLAKTDVIDWRNNANTGNLALGIDGSDNLTFNGVIVPSPSLTTPGGVLYVSSGNTITEDPSYLFYDTTNHALRVGTNTAAGGAASLTVVQATTSALGANSNALSVVNTSTGDFANTSSLQGSRVSVNRAITTSQTDTGAVIGIVLASPTFTIPAGQTLTNTNSSGFVGVNITAPTISGSGAMAFTRYMGINLAANSIATGTNKVGIFLGAQSGATNNSVLADTFTLSGDSFIYSLNTNPSLLSGTLTIPALGLGVSSPSGIIGISGQSAQTIQTERQTTANTAGNSFTLKVGGATVGATDKSGGSLILASGITTGTGTSSINLQTPDVGSAGTSDNALRTKLSIGNGGGITQTVSNGTGINVFLADIYGANNSHVYRNANGTVASPTKTVSGNPLYTAVARGYQEVTPGFTSGGAQFSFSATEDFTNVANGTQFRIWTVPNGSTTSTVAATFGQDQTLTMVGAISAPGITLSGLTASKAVVTNASKGLASSAATSTEVGYLSGVTSAIQTQIDSKVGGASNLTNAGAIPYAASSGVLADNPSLIFWDTTGLGLRIGTNAVNNTGAVESLSVLNSTSSALSAAQYGGTLISSSSANAANTFALIGANVQLGRTITTSQTDTSANIVLSLSGPVFNVPAAQTLTNTSGTGCAIINITAPTVTGGGSIAFNTYLGCNVASNTVNTGTRKVGIFAGSQSGSTNNSAIADNLSFMGTYFLNSTNTNPSQIAGILTVANATDSSSTSTGAIITTGGVGIAKSAQIGGSLYLTALTSGSVPFLGASGVVSQNNSNLFWNTTNLALQIGSNSNPASGKTPQFYVNTANNIGAAGDPGIILGGDANKERFHIYSSVQPVVAGFRPGGTIAAPSATTSGAPLLDLQGQAYDGSVYAIGARIRFDTAAASSAGSTPSKIRLQTCPSGSTTAVDAVIIDQDKNLLAQGGFCTQNFDTSTATSGTITASANVSGLSITGAGGTTLIIKLPSSPVNGQQYWVASEGAFTTVTWQDSGGTAGNVIGGQAAIGGTNRGQRFVYRTSTTKWYSIG